jgi:hypothetical protein
MSDHYELIGKVIAEAQLDSHAVTDAKLESLKDEFAEEHKRLGGEIEQQIEETRKFADDLMVKASDRNAEYHSDKLAELVSQRKIIEAALGDIAVLKDTIKDGEKGDKGEPGERGQDGLDRPLLEPVELKDDKDYEKSTLGTYNGSLWLSTKNAVGTPDDDPHAWHCVLDAMTSIDVDLCSPHEYQLTIKMGTGKILEQKFHIPYPEHMGIYDEEKSYKKGNIVTKGNSLWQAMEDTDGTPPGNGWQQILNAPRGKQGLPGKSIEGPQGKPGRLLRHSEGTSPLMKPTELATLSTSMVPYT